jgi:hypothetical protein
MFVDAATATVVVGITNGKRIHRPIVRGVVSAAGRSAAGEIDLSEFCNVLTPHL